MWAKKLPFATRQVNDQYAGNWDLVYLTKNNATGPQPPFMQTAAWFRLGARTANPKIFPSRANPSARKSSCSSSKTVA